MFPDKLIARWSGPFEILQVLPYEMVELKDHHRSSFIVNGNQIKFFHETKLHKVDTVERIRLVVVEVE